jgi:hypothetical protein
MPRSKRKQIGNRLKRTKNNCLSSDARGRLGTCDQLEMADLGICCVAVNLMHQVFSQFSANLALCSLVTPSDRCDVLLMYAAGLYDDLL